MSKHLQVAAAWLRAIVATRAAGLWRGGVVVAHLGIVLLAGAAALACSGAWASETLYYSFPKSAANPAGVVPSSFSLEPQSRQLLGTTRFGGANDAGTVFRFNQTAAPGTTSVQTVYSFGASATDGKQPAGGVVTDNYYNIYGVTSTGGVYGYGTLFKVDYNGNETILHSFGATADDGRTPNGGLVISGNFLFGSTSAGGPNAASGAAGSVFRYGISPASYIVYPAGSGATAGTMPLGNLLLLSNGGVLGTTYDGGASGYGTVFSLLDPTGSGDAAVTAFSFASAGVDGAHPNYSLISNNQNGAPNTNQYFGIVSFGGAYGAGGVFEYDSTSGAASPLSMLHSFGQQAIDGKKVSSLVVASDGNFYGTTEDGGQYASATDAGGTLFRLGPNGVETLLQSFGASATDGLQPAQRLYPYSSSSPSSAIFYGTTNGGGANNAGTIYRYVFDGTSVAPAAPANFFAITEGANAAYLSWSRPYGATSYSIYESTTSGAEQLVTSNNYGTAPGMGPDTTYGTANITGLVAGTKYYFKVSSSNSVGTSPLSLEQSVTPLPPPPGAPGGVIASPANGSVSLSWDPTASATGYEVYMNITSGSEGKNPAVASTTTTQALISGLTIGSTYYFKVTAVNAGGQGPYSAEVHAVPAASQPPAPAAPTAVAATGGDGHVYLTWQASANAAGYKVFMSTAPGGENLSGASAAMDSAAQALVNGLTDGTVYYFKVVAVNASGSSPASAEVHATPQTPPPPPPPAPSIYSAAPGSGQVTLSWSLSQGATYYKVFAGTQQGGNYYGAGAVAAVQTSALTATIASLNNGTTYYFRVVPYTAANVAGTPSGEASATPVAPPPAPSHVLASAGDQHVYLTWTGSAAATRYQVFMSTTSGGENLSGGYATAVTSTQALISSLSDGATYYFKVVAVGAGGSSPPSTEVHATPAVPPPAAPGGIAAAR